MDGGEGGRESGDHMPHTGDLRVLEIPPVAAVFPSLVWCGLVQ